MYGSVVAPFNEKVEIEIDSKRRKLISKNLLYGIIKPRYEEILEIIRDRIFDDINARLNIKSVVLTGGASKIFGIKNISENIFNRKAKVGKNLIGDISSQEKPEFSTLMGIIKLANDFFMYNQIPNKSSSKVSVIMDKIDNWIEESYA
jgi:cell division protein FtsA